MKRDDDKAARDAALLVARWIVGASLVGHGTQKLFGWFNGPGIEGATHFMRSLGFDPPDQHAHLASWTEIAAGILIAAGAFGPIGPAMLAGSMTTAAGSVHVKNGWFNQDQGFEMNTLYVLLGLLFGVEDYGRLSFDEVVGLRGKIPAVVSLLAIAGGAGAGALLLSRRNLGNGKEKEQTQGAVQTEHGSIDSTIEGAMID